MVTTIVNVIRVSRQPHSVLTNWISTLNSNSTPIHEVKQKVMKTAAAHKNLLADLNVSISEAVTQNTPPLLENPECTLNVFPNIFNVAGEIPLKSPLPSLFKRANRGRP
jgi:hypothetical protein